MANKALTINPRMATALASKGERHFARRRSSSKLAIEMKPLLAAAAALFFLAGCSGAQEAPAALASMRMSALWIFLKRQIGVEHSMR